MLRVVLQERDATPRMVQMVLAALRVDVFARPPREQMPQQGAVHPAIEDAFFPIARRVFLRAVREHATGAEE